MVMILYLFSTGGCIVNKKLNVTVLNFHALRGSPYNDCKYHINLL